MPKPRIISAGNFSRGMIPDQIGATNSAAMIMDGVVDRAGEVRLRGAKTNHGSVSCASTDTPFDAAYVGSSESIGGAVGEAIWAFSSDNGSGSAPTFFGYSGSDAYTAFTSLSRATGSSLYSTTWADHETLCVAGREILIGRDRGYSILKWAGSSKADYSTGTVSTTSGDNTITGSGTTWTTNIESGQYIHMYKSGSSLDGRYFLVTSVDSDTSIEVDVAPDETVSGLAYVATALGHVANSVSGSTVFSTPGSAGGAGGEVLAYHSDRLFTATFNIFFNGDLTTWEEEIRWSGLPNELDGKYAGKEYWHVDAYASVVPGQGGVITSMHSLGGSLVIVKESALAVLTGDLSTDGADLGARIDLVSGTVGSPSRVGSVVTPHGLVVCDRSGIWLVASFGAPQNLIDGKIRGLYREKFAASSQDVRASSVGDRLVVQVASGENTFVLDWSTGAWTMQDCALYSRIIDVIDSGNLVGELGAQRVSSTAYFDKWDTDLTSSGGLDSQSSTTPSLKLVTQPMELSDGGLPVGRPQAVYVDGFIREASSTDPYIAVSLLYGASGVDTGEESSVALAKTIAEGTYEDVHRIPVDAGDAKRRRQVRVVLESEAGSGECKVYGVWLAAVAAETVGA